MEGRKIDLMRGNSRDLKKLPRHRQRRARDRHAGFRSTVLIDPRTSSRRTNVNMLGAAIWHNAGNAYFIGTLASVLCDWRMLEIAVRE